MVQGYCPTGTSVHLAEILNRYKQRPYFFLSAHLTDENRRAYGELNVDTMLTKPFDVHELRELVDSLAHVA